MDEANAPVVIVGAGPVGLVSALALARHGVRSLVLERRRDVSELPRARFVNARTMEIFRQLAVEALVRAASVPDEKAAYAVWLPALTAPDVLRRRIETVGEPSGEPRSPAPGVTTSQDKLDPILLAAARATGLVEIRFGHRVSRVMQHDDGVAVDYVDTAGATGRASASYLLAADGASSGVREQLGIPMIGPSGLGHTMNIHFRADLDRAVRGRGVNLAFIMNPRQPGLLLNIDGMKQWTAQALYNPKLGQRPEDYTAQRCHEIIRTQVGEPELDSELLGVAPWSSAARVAERFRDRRVFLVGDAAHEMPPAGGFGMNTGVHDAHNLAWKVAAVLHKWAAASLLDSYEQERRPIAQWTTAEVLKNLTSVGRDEDPGSDRARAASAGPRPEFFREHALVFGARYASAAVIDDGTSATQGESLVVDYIPAGTPGGRAPHMWIELSGQRTSTLDLLGTHFTVLAAGVRTERARGLENATASAGVPLRAFTVAESQWADEYGVSEGGAVIVRPDGHVAWRGTRRVGAADILRALRAVLTATGAATAVL